MVMWGIKLSFFWLNLNVNIAFFTCLCSAIIFFLPLPTPSHRIFGNLVEGKTPVFSIETLKWWRSSVFSRAVVNIGMSSKNTFPKKKSVIWIFSGSTHLICRELCAIEDWISKSMGWISRPVGIPIKRRFTNSFSKSEAGNIQGCSGCHLPVDMPFYREYIFFHPGYIRRYNSDIH